MGRQQEGGQGTRRPDASDGVLEQAVRQALDAAGIQGLCREGRIEAAVGAARALRPDWTAAAVLAFVSRVADNS